MSGAVLMLVAQYPYPIVGGMQRQAHELSLALRRTGHDVVVISGTIGEAPAGFERVDGVEVHRLRWHLNPLARFVTLPWTLGVKMFALRHRYTVVHVHAPSWFGLFGILIARALAKPTLTKLPNVGAHGVPGVVRGWAGPVRRAILRASDAVVALSEASVRELVSIAYPPSRTMRCPNGIRLSPARRTRETREEIRIVFVGRLVPQKRVGDLLRAWAMLGMRTAHARLEVWGSGPEAASLVGLATELGIAGTVRFCGEVSDVRRELIAVDALVLPSSEEGNSNAILEAMDAAVPVIASSVGGTPLLLGEAGAPYLFRSGDVAMLTGALQRLLDDAETRRSYGLALRRRVERRFDIDRVAQVYATTYRLLERGQRTKIGSFTAHELDVGS